MVSERPFYIHINPQMGKPFELSITDGQLSYTRRTGAIEHEAKLDGIHVIRTSECKQLLSAEDAVRSFKNLAQVGRVFPTFKGLDIRIRPVPQRTKEWVRAHIFICLPPYYVEWHLRQVLAPLLFNGICLLPLSHPLQQKAGKPHAPPKTDCQSMASKHSWPRRVPVAVIVAELNQIQNAPLSFGTLIPPRFRRVRWSRSVCCQCRQSIHWLVVACYQ